MSTTQNDASTNGVSNEPDSTPMSTHTDQDSTVISIATIKPPILNNYFDIPINDPEIHGIRSSRFKVFGKWCIVKLTANAIEITEEKQTAPFHRILHFREILAIRQDKSSFFIYVFHATRVVVYQLISPDEQECTEWVQTVAFVVFGIQEGDLKKRNLLIILNPVSGDGSAKKDFVTHAEPVLMYLKNFIDFDYRETKKPNHAFELIQKADLSKYDGIVCVGGDGTFSEIVNGLLKREDWKKVCKIPIGIIPAGTSNGMATSLGFVDMKTAIYAIARGFYRSMDVCSVFQGEKRTYSVVAITWAIMANMKARKGKWHGGTWNAIKSAVSTKKYNAKIQFILDNEKKSIPNPLKSIHVDKLVDYSDKEFLNGPAINYLPTFGEVYSLITKETTEKTDTPNKDLQNIEDGFYYFVACKSPNLSSQFCAAPKAKLNDGNVDLVLMNSPTSKTRAFSQLMGEEDGSYIESKNVEYYKVKAFTLEPKSQGTFIVVDGEQLGNETILVECHQGLCNIFCQS